MVHIKRKKKINSDMGRKLKQEIRVYRKKHAMVGAFRRARPYAKRTLGSWGWGVKQDAKSR